MVTSQLSYELDWYSVVLQPLSKVPDCAGVVKTRVL